RLPQWRRRPRQARRRAANRRETRATWRQQCAGYPALASWSARSPSGLRDRNLERKIVDAFVAGLGHDEGMPEKDAEYSIRRDWIGLGHDDHAGLEHLVDLAGLGPLRENVRLVGDDIDAVHLRRARLHAPFAEEAAGEPHIIGGVPGFDFGDDLAIPGQRDLVPELAHHFSGRPKRDRRSDLGGQTVVAGRQLHVEDVALLELA